jgi:hypothetical protein
VVSFTPRPLYSQGNSPWYPLDRRLGGPQSRSGRGGEEKTYIVCLLNMAAHPQVVDGGNDQRPEDMEGR